MSFLVGLPVVRQFQKFRAEDGLTVPGVMQRLDAAEAGSALWGMPSMYGMAEQLAKNLLRDGEAVVEDPFSVFGIGPELEAAFMQNGFLRISDIYGSVVRTGYSWRALDGCVLVSCGCGFHVVRVGELGDVFNVTMQQQMRAIASADVKARLCLPSAAREVKVSQGVQLNILPEVCRGNDGLLGRWRHRLEGQEKCVPPRRAAGCFTRLVPTDLRPEAVASLPDVPTADLVSRFLRDLKEELQVNGVVLELRDRLLHVDVDEAAQPTSVKTVADCLGELPVGTVVAGRCSFTSGGLLTTRCADCSTPKAKLVQDREDLNVKCRCSPFDSTGLVFPQGRVVNNRDIPDLSKMQSHEVAYLFDKSEASMNQACRVVDVSGNVHKAVRVHREGDSGYVHVTGEYLEMLVPAGSEVHCAGGRLVVPDQSYQATSWEAVSDSHSVAGPAPIVIYGCYRRLACEFKGGRIPEYVEVRNRPRSAWVRRMHQTTGEDVSDTFAAFWSKVGVGLALLTWGRKVSMGEVNDLCRIPRSGRVASKNALGEPQPYEWADYHTVQVKEEGVYSGGLEGTCVRVNTGEVAVGPVRLSGGSGVVLGRYSSDRFVIKSVHGHAVDVSVDLGENSYNLDDGGLSNSDYSPLSSDDDE